MQIKLFNGKKVAKNKSMQAIVLAENIKNEIHM
jgi:hypothetical protein